MRRSLAKLGHRVSLEPISLSVRTTAATKRSSVTAVQATVGVSTMRVQSWRAHARAPAEEPLTATPQVKTG